MKYLGAASNDGYHNPKTDFRSYFLTFDDGARLELMHKPEMPDQPKELSRTGYAHIAFRVGSREKVDALTAELKANGYKVINGPRTTGDGYKGMLHQPDPSERPDMLKGLIAVRSLHMRALSETGFSCADEMLYPENPRYLSDVLSYVAVGARSVEDQQHRLCASGLDIPCGMKNPTSGDISIMLNSITAAQHSHTFIYRGWEVRSLGNPLAHAILRGYVDDHGIAHPNYHYEDLMGLFEAYSAKGLTNMAVLVDTNHANSGKKWFEQIRIAKEVLHSCRYSDDVRSLVKGLMIESYIEDGAQKIGENIYGKSITDPCLGWDKTEKLIYEIADVL